MVENDAKYALRTIARKRLSANAEDRSLKSALIWDRLSLMDSFRSAWGGNRLMVYLDFDFEVRTTNFLVGFLGIPRSLNFFGPAGPPNPLESEQEAAASSLQASRVGPSVIVPFCEAEEIVPITIEAMDELEKGRYGILEPKPEIRERAERRVSPETIDFVLVPGLAFDRVGNRLGRGKGYYDRFLAELSPKTPVAGLAFECQIFENLPFLPHDRKVDLIVTEDRVIVRR